MGLHKEQISAFVSPAAAKSLQSCPTLCDPWDGSPPGSPVLGILQARTLEWVISFSNAWKWRVKVKSLSHVRLLVTPWTAAYQAPPSMGFSRQECWSGVPLPPPSENTINCIFCGKQETFERKSEVKIFWATWFVICFPLLCFPLPFLLLFVFLINLPQA